MKMLVPPLTLTLLLLVNSEAQAIKIAPFTDVDTLVRHAQDIVIAKCTGPVPVGQKFQDGLYPVDVQILTILKGGKKPGKATIATIYPMEVGKIYLLTSLGGSAYGTDFLAVPELAVVELPHSFRLDDLKDKKVTEQVQAVLRHEIERRQRERGAEKETVSKGA
jgi:hypothetical protein